MAKPVVVYGASGYTGRLVCEYLRQYHVPFIAAGRDEAKLKASMDSHVPGIETADYEVAAVDHDVASLTDLFKGASVVLNTVGPFSELGPVAVEAALAAGAHYTDTTGEQDWLMTCDEKYGPQFAEANLVLAPGIAQMYTTSEIAAQLCLEQPGLDTLDIAVFWGGSPTIASTRTILVNAATSKAHYLENNQYAEFPTQGLVSLVVPGQHELALSLPWGGMSHPVWFKRDPRVANCKAQGGVFNAALMNGVPQIVAAALEATKDMSPEDRDTALTETARQVMNEMPPGRTRASTRRWTPCTRPGRSDGRTVSSTATATTSRPVCSRRSRRTRCCRRHRGGSVSRVAVRHSVIASSSAYCGASGWCPSRS